LIDGTVAIFPVTEDDIRRSRKTDEWFNSTVRFDPEHGGGYMGTLEMFHQLHCVNMLRMNLRPSRYHTILEWNTTEAIFTKHLDHCIDILRQVVMCSADTSLLTFHWVEGNPFPYPDFSTWHRCRSPDAVLAWALERQPSMDKLMAKGKDSVEMPKAP